MRVSRSIRLSRGVKYLVRIVTQTHLLTFIIVPYVFLQYTSIAQDSSLRDVFSTDLFRKYGSNGTISAAQVNSLLTQVRSKYIKNVLNEYVLVEDSAQDVNASVDIRKFCDIDNVTRLPSCLIKRCLSAYDTFNLYDIPTNHLLNETEFFTILPVILFEAQKKDCHADGMSHDKTPSSKKVWGYGFLFVTIINICSMGGALVLPFTRKSMYKQVMTFLVGLAVGSLAATGLMVLIPEALHLFTVGQSRVPLILKAITIFGGIYLFFLIERLLKILMVIRQKKFHEDRGDCLTEIHNLNHSNHLQNHHVDDLMCSIKAYAPQTITETHKMKDPSSLPIDVTNNCMLQRCSSDEDMMVPSPSPASLSPGHLSTTFSNGDVILKPQQNGYVVSETNDKLAMKTEKRPTHIASIAWMIIFGDGLHNFIDGLSMGAAFTQKILTGVSVSLAVICEEIPHELGDFAILLKAGMTVKQALFFNLLSAATCYLGLIVGIMLGESTMAHEWIFALAGGMFLYISLVDMLPEMNSSAEEEERLLNTVCSMSVFILQNAGIIAGFGIITVMTLYAEHINFE